MIQKIGEQRTWVYKESNRLGWELQIRSSDELWRHIVLEAFLSSTDA